MFHYYYCYLYCPHLKQSLSASILRDHTDKKSKQLPFFFFLEQTFAIKKLHQYYINYIHWFLLPVPEGISSYLLGKLCTIYKQLFSHHLLLYTFLSHTLWAAAHSAQC